MFAEKESAAAKALNKPLTKDQIISMQKLIGSGEFNRNPLTRQTSEEQSIKLNQLLDDGEQTTPESAKRLVKVDYLRPDYNIKSYDDAKDVSFSTSFRREKVKALQKTLRDSIDSPRDLDADSESDEEQNQSYRLPMQIGKPLYTPSFAEKDFQLTEASPTKLPSFIQDLDARV